MLRPSKAGHAVSLDTGTALVSGEPAVFTLPKVTTSTLFTGDFSYVINVPERATRLDVQLSCLNAEVDMYVRQGTAVTLNAGRPQADYTADADGGVESLTISGSSLKPALYYIAFGLFTTDVTAVCALTATYTATIPTNTLTGSHFVAGDGWYTSLFVTNLAGTSESFTVKVYGNDGTALKVPFQQGTVDSIAGALRPGATQVFETVDAPSLQQGWVAVIPNTPNTARLSGFAVFRYRRSGQTDYEAVVPINATRLHSAVVMYDNASGFETGVALINCSEFSTITLQVKVKDESGAVVGTYPVTLPPLGHTAIIASQGFPATAGKRGSLLLTASGGTFEALGLRFSPAGPFTSFPVLPID